MKSITILITVLFSLNLFAMSDSERQALGDKNDRELVAATALKDFSLRKKESSKLASRS